MWEYNQTNYLCHHGVKGQKWGIRKDNHNSDSTGSKHNYATSKGLANDVKEFHKGSGRAIKIGLGIAAAKTAIGAAQYKKSVLNPLADFMDNSIKLNVRMKDVARVAATEAGKAYVGAMIYSKSKPIVSNKLSEIKSNRTKSKTNNDWKKRYGELEDQLTYGKNADKAKNARIQKEMEELERRNR